MLRYQLHQIYFQNHVVPIGIKGTLQVNPASSFKLRPHKIEVNIGNPIDPSEYPNYSPDKLAKLTQQKVEGLLVEL